MWTDGIQVWSSMLMANKSDSSTPSRRACTESSSITHGSLPRWGREGSKDFSLSLARACSCDCVCGGGIVCVGLYVCVHSKLRFRPKQPRFFRGPPPSQSRSIDSPPQFIPFIQHIFIPSHTFSYCIDRCGERLAQSSTVPSLVLTTSTTTSGLPCSTRLQLKLSRHFHLGQERIASLLPMTGTVLWYQFSLR